MNKKELGEGRERDGGVVVVWERSEVEVEAECWSPPPQQTDGDTTTVGYLDSNKYS